MSDNKTQTSPLPAVGALIPHSSFNTSKAVTIQPASVPKVPIPKLKIQPKVLEEENYVEAMDKIIKRDYFPHVFSTEELNAKEVEESNVNTNMSLDKFVSQHTSEDNASFDKIIEKKNELNKQKYQKFFSKNDVPNLDTIEAWKPSITNPLLWIPDGVPLSETEEKLYFKGASKEIAKENTRLDEDIFKKPDSSLIQEKSSSRLRHLRNGKVDLDDLRNPEFFLDSPQIGGYSFVMTPSPMPGADGDEPILSWGTIEGTPISLESPKPQRIFPSFTSASPGPSFYFPEISKREELVQQLEKSREQAKEKNRSKNSTTNILFKKGSNTPLRSPSPLHSSIDPQLRASYNTPSRKRSLSSSSTNTPVSKTPRISPFPSPKS